MSEGLNSLGDSENFDFNEMVKEFYNFFESEKLTDIKRSYAQEKTYLEVDYEELLNYKPELLDFLIEQPEDAIKIMEKSLEIFEDMKLSVRISSLPVSERVHIRDIRSEHLGKLILLEGLVKRKTDVRPRLTVLEYLCTNPECNFNQHKLRVPQTEEKAQTKKTCPKCKAPLDQISKILVDSQNLALEEIHEQVQSGDQSKNVNVLLTGDLVSPLKDRKTNPGRKVYVIGFVKEIPMQNRAGSQTVNFELLIEGNYIGTLEEDFSDIQIEKDDLDQIKELAKRDDIYDLLSDNLAPSIYGHKRIKEAIILQLFGGTKMTRADGVRTRGDIHILLIGDPGSAKSQLLKSTIGIAPKGSFVSGKSASSAGLTAAVVKDEMMKGWALEAGALVLANGGICAIDEMDKMSQEDTSSMHEALEQQTISIAKANIRATLVSETVVLAAANPKYGRFDPYSDIYKQIDMPPSLVNRFDLIFVIKDLPDKTRDSLIADHILRVHKDKNKTKRNIDIELLKKYVAYTKEHVKPILNDDALEEIKNFYVNLRNSVDDDEEEIQGIPISARQLEAILRLAEAYAKIKLCKEVTLEHAKRAIEMMMYTLEEIGKDPKTGKIDIDKITTGITASTRNSYKTVKNIIDKLEIENPEVHYDDILDKAKEKNLTSEEVQKGIAKLKEEGIIYEPKKKIYKKIM